MIVLYVILGIILLVLLILMLRVQINVSYKKEPNGSGCSAVIAAIGPVRIRIYPKKEKKIDFSDYSAKNYRKKLAEDAEKKSLQKKQPEKKQEKNKSTLLPGGIGETVELVLEMVEKFTGHLTCEIRSMKIIVGTGNAASTALAYTAAASALSFIIETLDHKTKLSIPDNTKVSVIADYKSGDFGGDISIKLSIRIINVLRAGSGFIKNYFRTMIRLDKQN